MESIKNLKSLFTYQRFISGGVVESPGPMYGIGSYHTHTDIKLSGMPITNIDTELDYSGPTIGYMIINKKTHSVIKYKKYKKHK